MFSLHWVEMVKCRRMVIKALLLVIITTLILIQINLVSFRITPPSLMHLFPSQVLKGSNYGSIPMPDWLPQCRKIYLDVGSNIGVMARKFFEPEKYPNSSVIELFDKLFGNSTSRKGKDSDLCVIGFEPNTKHHRRLDRIMHVYRKFKWKVHFIKAAVGVDNNNVTFYSHEYIKEDLMATIFKNRTNELLKVSNATVR